MDNTAGTDQKDQSANLKPEIFVGLHMESVNVKGEEISSSSRSNFKHEAKSPGVEEERRAVLEYGQQIERVNKSLVSLKAKLTQIREDDLSLLKRLIRIGDSIRRLSRHHRRYAAAPASLGHHQRTQDLMTSAADLSVTLRRFQGHRRDSLLTSGDPFNTVPLLRRQSAPQVCTLGMRGSTSSRPGSTCSTDWMSDDMLEMGSSDDGIDSVDSEDDILEDDSFDTLTWREPGSLSRAFAHRTSAKLAADISTVANHVSKLFGHSNLSEASKEGVLNIPDDTSAAAPSVPIFFIPELETRATADIVDRNGSEKVEEFGADRLRKSSKPAGASDRELRAKEKLPDLPPVLCQLLDSTCTTTQKLRPDTGTLNVPTRLSSHEIRTKVDRSSSRIATTPLGKQCLEGESDLSESRNQGPSSVPNNVRRQGMPTLSESPSSGAPEGEHVDHSLVDEVSSPGSSRHSACDSDGTSAQKRSPSITLTSRPNSAVDRGSSQPSSTPSPKSPAPLSSRPRSTLDVPLRKKSHSVVAETFLAGGGGQDGGDLSGTYSVILRQNVKLWKERLGQASSVRERISVLEEES